MNNEETCLNSGHKYTEIRPKDTNDLKPLTTPSPDTRTSVTNTHIDTKQKESKRKLKDMQSHEISTIQN